MNTGELLFNGMIELWRIIFTRSYDKWYQNWANCWCHILLSSWQNYCLSILIYVGSNHFGIIWTMY